LHVRIASVGEAIVWLEVFNDRHIAEH
jgi:hypothetical protein